MTQTHVHENGWLEVSSNMRCARPEKEELGDAAVLFLKLAWQTEALLFQSARKTTGPKFKLSV